jgi:hypothetical protein
LRRRLSPGLPLSRSLRRGKRSCRSTAVNDVRCCWATRPDLPPCRRRARSQQNRANRCMDDALRFVHVVHSRTSTRATVHVSFRASFTCGDHLRASGEISSSPSTTRRCMRSHGAIHLFPEGETKARKGASSRCRGRCLYGRYGWEPGRDTNHATPECTGIVRSRPIGICVRRHTDVQIFRRLTGSRALCDGVVTASQAWLGTRTNRSGPGHSHAIPWPCVPRSATQMDAPSSRGCSRCSESDCSGS